MHLTEFNNVAHARHIANGYKYMELIGCTGPEQEVEPGVYKRVFELKAHKARPESIHYVLDINDPEIKALTDGEDSMIYYIR